MPSLVAGQRKSCLHRAREALKTELLKGAAGVELFDYPATYCDPMTSKVMQAILALPEQGAASSSNA